MGLRRGIHFFCVIRPCTPLSACNAGRDRGSTSAQTSDLRHTLPPKHLRRAAAITYTSHLDLHQPPTFHILGATTFFFIWSAVATIHLIMAVGTLSSSAPVAVASIGACGSGGSTLLNELFQTSLPVAPRRGVQTTRGVAEAEAASSQAVVLDVEGFDSRCVGRVTRRRDLWGVHPVLCCRNIEWSTLGVQRGACAAPWDWCV